MTITDTALREVALTRDEYAQIVLLLDREPTPVELGMFGAMWSEHCGYKNSRPLLTLFPSEGARVLQGPGENAGAVDIGDGLAVVFKIESHNHPSAIEPYEGAATGVGGIVRDIFTMGARPVALLNSLRFGPLSQARNRYLFRGVVGGIGGYGNSLGIPTVAGDIFFDDSYSGNPLVNAMCVGIVPHESIMRARASGVGNLVVLVGADTGRDGIHGATFASVENPEESHRGVVQVGNPFLEKLLLEACLEALHVDGVVAMQDLGAAGLTSSIVECASKGGLGIELDVARVSRRETGMTPYEVMLSESQERMLIIVREDGLPTLREIFDRWDLHSDVIGVVTGDGHVRVMDGSDVAADVPAVFFTDECPTYVRDGVESPAVIAARQQNLNAMVDVAPAEVVPTLLRLLGSHNICSREPVVRTYDHTILSNTVVPPLEGDAAVIRIKDTSKGLSVKTDCNPRFVYLDPFLGGQHAVAEAARNVSCTGATPLALTNCLNFGSPEKPDGYYQLKQAVAGMAKAAEALGTPIVSGNVSLYNESNDGPILPTPTVGVVGLLDDVQRHAGMAPSVGDVLYVLGEQRATLGGSEYLALIHGLVAGSPPGIDLTKEALVQSFVRDSIRSGLVHAAHDTSEGGLLVALAEMLIAARAGLDVDLSRIAALNDGRLDRGLFGEAASRVLVSCRPEQARKLEQAADEAGVMAIRLGTVSGTTLAMTGIGSVDLSALTDAWRSGLVNIEG
ncbi:MAG TPA: phosphoribosylformylglycinamidine synthase subunit PurL [Thermomicrobiales bacterium]|nr:phosphoribosylformylglycinamidine synthase subunit PurL [Thermomicrobiales bacterium]